LLHPYAQVKELVYPYNQHLININMNLSDKL
jgi:hypothetical protein